MILILRDSINAKSTTNNTNYYYDYYYDDYDDDYYYYYRRCDRRHCSPCAGLGSFPRLARATDNRRLVL